MANLSQISIIVSKYLYNTEGKSVIETESKNCLNFRKWSKSLSRDSVLRLYTLNYDNLFKGLLEKENINCFDGFYSHSDNNFHYKPDVLRILSDTISNTHYNLHGSVYWQVKPLDNGGLRNYEIVLTKGISRQLNDTPATIQMEKGKTIQVTNIITGYQKTQKSAITPFRQLQSAFDKDCYTADKITFVGYSFNDEHINESLKMALRYNNDVSIVIVDPSFIKSDMDFIFALGIFPFINSNNLNPTKVAENKFNYYNGKLKVYTMNFSEYIESEIKNSTNA